MPTLLQPFSDRATVVDADRIVAMGITIFPCCYRLKVVLDAGGCLSRQKTYSRYYWNYREARDQLNRMIAFMESLRAGTPNSRSYIF